MRCLTIGLSLLCMVLTAEAAKADRRVAFVVGNGAYTNVAPLPNPPVDAKAMAATLRNVGFDVVEGTNLTRDKMTEKLLDFGRKAQGADIAVFYYAGHGIAISGTNYLLPVDADLKSEMDVKLGSAINIDVTLDQTMGDAKVKLVFLDACRDNPFAAKIKSNSPTRSVAVQTGLAEMKSGEGTLIAFATGPGQTALDGEAGANSPFTRALIAHIAQPGVEIQQAMTEVRAQVNEETSKGQLPWGHTNLIGAVYLNPAATPATSAAAIPGNVPANAASSANAEAELEFWRSVKDSNRPEELNAYLSTYPNGQFKTLALARIASIESGAANNATRNVAKGVDPAVFTEEGSQVSEDQIGLDKSKRRDVQRRLTGLGFDTKMTGIFDDETRGVVKRWQAARGYPSTGYLTRLQHKALLAEPQPAPATASMSDPAAKPRRARPSGNVAAGSAPPPSAAPVYRNPPPDNAGNAAGAAFIGGMMGGVLGGALRR
ncbi:MULTISPECIES: caspase family protein [unclassified Bradyrhizobium]|uniref:caspase family protein n=1 Tax=unclassified Bradyrhizobium TaxID=2631580 RepID=UPI0028E3527B|nr:MULTISPECIES: caspase family protein [unclassified Bradyrhizobium]